MENRLIAIGNAIVGLSFTENSDGKRTAYELVLMRPSEVK